MKSGKQNHFYLIRVGWAVIVLLLGSLTSCSDDEIGSAGIEVSNFTLTISENPADGAVLGNVSVTATGGSLTYAITTQTPEGAMAIDPTTGQLTVNDRKKFNFELYPTITGTFTATNGRGSASGTITITLTDVDETVQERLDDGETPKQIYDSDNSLLGQILGKNYGGGFIVLFSPTSGNGLVLSEEINGGRFNYPTAQTIANAYTGGGFTNWRIPEETDLMAISAMLNVYPNSLPLTGSAWAKGTCCSGNGGLSYFISVAAINTSYASTATGLLPVRAIRQF